MDLKRALSPTAFSQTGTLRARPNGPRAPKQAPKDSIPLDMCARSIEEATPAYSSPRSSARESLATPAYAPEEPPFESGRQRRMSVGVQTSTSAQATNGEPATSAAPPAVKAIRKVPTLSPPPPLNLEPVPIQWRGMSLSTAKWTLTSAQLQEMVSTAIRQSAQESFIRLVPLETLEGDVDRELQRLESLKATSQAQYRFSMQRRMMLLQSINALSYSQLTDGSGGGETLANLTAQLAETTAACDRLLETLLSIADQRAQIQRLQDVHVASALAMAVRKMNESYGRRVDELAAAGAQIDELRDELDEAWQIAEEMAQEMDALDNFDLGFGDDDVASEFDDVSAVVGDSRTEHSVQLAEVVGITGKAVAAEARYTSMVGALRPPPVADRASRVVAARRRSMRTSKASLRLPRQPSESSVSPRRARSRSKSRRRPSMNSRADVPAVPAIRIDTAPSQGSFLELAETRPTSPMSPAAPAQIPAFPQVLMINPTSKRDTIELPEPSPNPTIPSPGFDRTVIPPLTMHAAKDDLCFTSARERKLSMRRVQSLQPQSRTTDSLYGSLHRTSADHRELDGTFPDKLGSKPKRYSVPLKATLPMEPVESAPSPPQGEESSSQHKTTDVAS
ncbi:hypothetical protein WOLCODRAFT_139058 [Wolfiporia cocos MD-104 SS10]|uniref:Uncharacterized protein n=1 Tax=Wolfiporia cocos (strain MD-104) TaxID=742152 RepID=A0A2H3JQV9_WOLCO|nr:hypothetical protein WOLCODRAFT_139058 [Wolfiporia cocos MD-104 SS10]